MVGPRLRSPQSSSPARREQQRASSRLLVRRSVSINGQVFSTLIHDGASAERVIESIARENGGGVAKVSNKELNAMEIVAVKIGRNLLVKGEPDKVADADFSQFDNAGRMRKSALKASKESKGGIHFFLGERGVPLAVNESGELMFPNANEFCIMGAEAGTIHIDLVDYNADPLTLRDLNGMYSDKGGIRFSQMARELVLTNFQEKDLIEGHGGVRSEKLMLADTSVLIFDIEGGEMKTVREHSGKAEGFMAPQFDVSIQSANDPSMKMPAFYNVGLLLPTHLGPMLIPMDGSAVKVPYLFVKVFDGRAEDAVKVFEPLDDIKPISHALQGHKEHLQAIEPKHIKAKVIQLRKLLETARRFCYVEKDSGVKPALVLRPVFVNKRKSEELQPDRHPSRRFQQPGARRPTGNLSRKQDSVSGTRPSRIPTKPMARTVPSQKTSRSRVSKTFKVKKATAPKKKSSPSKVRKAKIVKKNTRKKSKKKAVKKAARKPKQPMREGLMRGISDKKGRASKPPRARSAKERPKEKTAKLPKPKKLSPVKTAANRTKTKRKKTSVSRAAMKPKAKPERARKRKEMPSHHRKEMLGLTSKKKKVSGRTRARSSL
jgi:hypothetical protein